MHALKCVVEINVECQWPEDALYVNWSLEIFRVLFSERDFLMTNFESMK